MKIIQDVPKITDPFELLIKQKLRYAGYSNNLYLKVKTFHGNCDSYYPGHSSAGYL